MRVLYAMVTRHCNLSCAHCDIRTDADDGWNEEAFLRALKAFDGRRILFGGEPSVCIDRTKLVAPYCDSVSTNLLQATDEFLSVIQNLGVATSWTPGRFTKEQERAWLENVQRLHEKPTLLVTLTPDLVMNPGTGRFMSLLRRYGDSFSDVTLEQLEDATKPQEYYDYVDDWLCWLYKETEGQRHLFPQFQKGSKWIYDCSKTYTLLPTGELRYGCPQYKRTEIVAACYSCPIAEKCQPCRLQKKCTGPQKLLQLIGNDTSKD